MIIKYKYGLIGIVLILMLCGTTYAQTQTGYRIPTRVDIGGGRMTGDMYLQAGTSGVRLYIGTDTVTQVGTSGVITGTIATNLPYLHFRHEGGSTSVNFIGFSQVMVGSTAVSVGDIALKVNITNGTCTGLTGTNTTLGGTNTIPSTGVFTANGRVLTDIEVSYLDGLSDFLTTLLAGKQADLGGTYCASMSDDVGTRTGAIRLGASGDLTLSIINGEFVYGLTGSASAKSSTMENGGTVTASPSFIDYDGDDFDPVGSGTGSRIKLSTAQKGSTTPTANTVVKGDANGKIDSWIGAGTGNDFYTKILLHFNEVGSPTTFLESSDSGLTVSTSGNAIGTTTQSVYGGTSLLTLSSGDYVSIADNPELELENKNFFIDFRFRPTGTYGYFIDKWQGSNDYIYLAYQDSSDNFRFIHRSASVDIIDLQTGSITVNLNQWYHFALSRKGSSYKFYLDGSQIYAGTDTSSIIDNTAGWSIGSSQAPTAAYYDEFRLSIGHNRHNGTFTSPTAAYGSPTTIYDY